MQRRIRSRCLGLNQNISVLHMKYPKELYTEQMLNESSNRKKRWKEYKEAVKLCWKTKLIDQIIHELTSFCHSPSFIFEDKIIVKVDGNYYGYDDMH